MGVRQELEHRKLASAQPLAAEGRGYCRSPGDVEGWQHVGGAGYRVRPADSERARAAGCGAAATGEDGDRAGTKRGRFEEGDTSVGGPGRHGDAEGSPGGAGPQAWWERGGGGRWWLRRGLLSDLATRVSDAPTRKDPATREGNPSLRRRPLSGRRGRSPSLRAEARAGEAADTGDRWNRAPQNRACRDICRLGRCHFHPRPRWCKSAVICRPPLDVPFLLHI